MNKIILLLGLLVGIGASAQDETVKKLKSDASKDIKKDPADTIPQMWKRGGLYNLTLSQGSLSNWAAGGDDFSLSLNTLLNLYAYYRHGHWSWDNTFDLTLGYLHTTSQGGRKNDDRIDLLSKLGHAMSSDWSVSGLFNFRTQMLKGYDYTEDQKK